MKTTGILGYRSEEDTKHYISAIGSIVGKLNKAGINIQFQNMEPADRILLINAITKQIRLQAQGGKCLTGFFKPAITPRQLDDKTDLIIKNIVADLGESVSPASPQPSSPKPLLSAGGFTEMATMSDEWNKLTL